MLVLLACSWGRPAGAQTLGTFHWQQLPYCNVLTLRVVQDGGTYRLDGVDDQCGAPTRAAVSGVAFPNPNGTVGMGLTLVMTPGGIPLHLDATIDLATVSGTWRSGGDSGAFVFRPGAGSSGPPRPVPRQPFLGGISLGGTTITNVAPPVAAADGANKAYVDASSTVVVPLIGAGAPNGFAFPAPQMQTPSRTFVTPRAGHLLVSLDVSGNVECASIQLANWWIAVDGVPLTSSVRHVGAGPVDFDHIGFPPVHLTGITDVALPAGPHVVTAYAACIEGQESFGYTTSELVGGHAIVLDERYPARMSAPPAAAVESPARPPLACVTDRRTRNTVCK